jgi:hypothetical protein
LLWSADDDFGKPGDDLNDAIAANPTRVVMTAGTARLMVGPCLRNCSYRGSRSSYISTSAVPV